MVRGQSGTSVIWEVDHDANLPVIIRFQDSVDLVARSIHQAGFCPRIPREHDLCTHEIYLLSSRSPSKYSCVGLIYSDDRDKCTELVVLVMR